MTNLVPSGIHKIAALWLTVAIMGCSSSDDSPIDPTSCVVSQRMSLISADDPDVCVSTETPSVLALETTTDASLPQNEFRVYLVDSDTDISLVSSKGNADLFLFDNFVDINTEDPYRDEKLLCGSWWGFKEDVCSASVPDGKLFAVVIAQTDSDYSISATAECSVPTINSWVYRSMLDYYLYADNVPNVDPAAYSSPSDLLQDLRFEDLDPFSSIRDTDIQTNFFEAGEVFGLGNAWRRDDNDDLRIIYTFADSAFGRAGIKRGDIAVSLNGESLDSSMSTERFFQLIGSEENPLTSNWEMIDGETGQTKFVSATIGTYRINSVLYSEVFTTPDNSATVGYLVFNEFIEPSVAELNTVIEDFRNRGVSELILDLRYNGGGRSSVGRRLAGQIAGPILEGQLQSHFKHNTKYSRFDYDNFFDSNVSPSLDLSRMIVLTTRSTASASERLINSLSPYIEVVTMGSTTRGKPFRSNGRQYCGKTLNAMQTQGENSVGVSVSGGINADCYADDDKSNDFGTNEGMFQSALDYMLNGTCQSQPLIAARTAVKEPPTTYESILFENMAE